MTDIISLDSTSELLVRAVQSFERTAPLVKQMRPRTVRTIRLFEKAKIYGHFEYSYASAEDRARAIVERVPLLTELEAEKSFCELAIASECPGSEIAKAVSWLAKTMPFGTSSANEYAAEAFVNAVSFPRPENSYRGFSLPVVMYAVRTIIDRDKAMPPVSRMLEACAEAKALLCKHWDAAHYLIDIRVRAEDAIAVIDGTLPSDDETIPF